MESGADPTAVWQIPRWIVIIRRNIKPKLHGGQAVRLLSMNLILFVSGELNEMSNRQDIRWLVTRQIGRSAVEGLHGRRGVRLQPEDIGRAVPGGIDRGLSVSNALFILHHGWLDGLAHPFMDFTVAVSKGKSTRAIMIAGGEINNGGEGAGLGHLHCKLGIVDAVRVFINKYPERACPGNNHGGGLAVGAPG